MHSTYARFAGILALAAAVAAPPAQAQDAPGRFFAGVGGGLSLIDEPRANASHLGGALHLRAGWNLRPNAALMLEGSMNGIGSARPDSVQVFGPGEGGLYYVHFSRTLKTQWLVASVQLGGPGSLYVRPGVGISRHAFLVLKPLPNDEMVEATSWEMAPALTLSVGRVAPIPGFPLNVEGVVGWSGSEDSTNPRWTAGVQVARVIHF